MADVLMPKLSDTMEEGKILRWLKHPGERVAEGDLLVEVETDKADMEIEATAAGVLREVRLDEGESGRVGEVIAVIDDGASEGESPARPAPRESATRDREKTRAAAPRKTEEEAEEAAEAASAEEERAEEKAARPVATRSEADEGSSGTRAAAPRQTRTARTEHVAPRAVGPARAASRQESVAPKGKARISPLARSLAAELGVDPDGIRGTGPGGRIVRRDVQAAAGVEPSPGEGASATGATAGSEAASREPSDEDRGADRPPRAEAAEPAVARPGGKPVTRPQARTPEPAPRAASTDGVRSVPLSPMRASIARRMTESKREAPHFYLNAVVDMEAAHRLREEMRASETVAAIVTFNHMIVKAAADALRAHPELNARFAGDAVDILDGVHVGIATAVPDGLIVPVIHDADRKSLVEIATAARALAEKARSRTFSGDELSGATFTVSNLGMYGVESFAAVINPPQAAILAVGAVAVRPFVREGALVAAHTVVLTLSCDHRAVDGARGAEFLRDVGIRLENPARLLFPASTPEP